MNNTEFGYLDGVTSAVQTQLDGKVVGAASATDKAIARFDGATGKVVQNSGVVIDNSGNVGIGITNPYAKLVVSGGQILSMVKDAGSSISINWNDGNVQYTSASCQTTSFSFSNMFEGGSYTLFVTGSTSGTCSFSQSGVTVFKFLPPNAPTLANKTSVYNFIRAGNIVYVSWATGY